MGILHNLCSREKTRTHEDKERAPMAASVTLPPPGPAREFYCRVSPGRPPPDTPTDRAHRKKFGAPHCSDPCSPLLAPARHCRLGCRGCRAPARPRRCATTNCTSWARTNDQNVPDPNAAPTRPRPRLDLPMRTNWPLINQYLSLICRGHAAPPHGQPTLLSRHSTPRGRLSPTALPSPAAAPPALQPNQLCAPTAPA